MDSLLETELPGTPDFDVYETGATLTDVHCEGTVVVADWNDGRQSRFYAVWLRDNCAGPESLNAVTREQTTSPLRLSPETHAGEVWIDAAGALCLRWAQEGFVSRFHPGWLRAHDYGHQAAADAGSPPLHLWNADEMPEPATFDGREILTDDLALEQWLAAYARYGIARLTGVVTEDGMVTQVGQRLGTVRTSNFGYVFDVKSKIDADSNAYTSLALEPHTDLGTREYQPGLQFLHCLRNTAKGGRAVMVDGYRVAEAIKSENPEAFRALCEIEWTWTNRHADSDYRWRAPFIAVDPSGGYREVRATYFLRGPSPLPEGRVEEAYESIRVLYEYLHDPGYRMVFPYASGDLVGFDNRRILHAREAFEADHGERWLQGCYLERDELASRLRILDRRRRGAT